MGRLSLEDVSNNVEQMPSLSRIAVELIKVIDDPNCTREDVRKLIALDEVLYAQIFKYANSVAIFGTRGVINSLDRAIDVIGLNELKNLAFTAAAHSMFGDKDLWRQSVFVAVAAQNFARQLDFDKQDVSNIYIAGLLNGFGVLVFNTFYKEEYEAIAEIENREARLAAEKEYFGLNNYELGYMALKGCGLPENITELIYAQQFMAVEQFQRSNALIELAVRISELEDCSSANLKKLANDATLLELVQHFSLSSIKIDKENIQTIEEMVDSLTSI